MQSSSCVPESPTQLQEELNFIQGRPSALEQVYEREQQGWQLFYSSLAAVKQALSAGES